MLNTVENVLRKYNIEKRGCTKDDSTTNFKGCVAYYL